MATAVPTKVRLRRGVRQDQSLPVINRAIRNLPSEGERIANDGYFQRCGGGRRIFRKKLG